MNNNETQTPSARGALAALSLSMLLSSLGTSIANVALPTLAEAFSASFHEVQWIVIAYLLAITISIVGVGRLGDRVGRRRLLLGGIALFMLASLLSGVASGLGLLIAGRAAQGVGAAAMMALTLAFVAETVPKAKTGSAMGLLGTMSAIGTALGPTLGGLLISVFGWRFIFLANLPLGILAFGLAYRYLPAARSEASARSPLIPLAALGDPTLSAALLTNLLVATVMMATLVVGPFYLSSALGLDPARVGLVMSAGPLVVALAGVPAGRIVDRLGAPWVTAAGLTAMAAGAFLLFLVPRVFGVPGYVAPIVVMTFGYALFQTANNTAVMANVRADERGVISGVLNLSRNLGLITGASVMGAVFALGSGTSDITMARPEAVASGMRITFAVAAMLIALGLVISVRARALAGSGSKSPARLT